MSKQALIWWVVAAVVIIFLLGLGPVLNWVTLGSLVNTVGFFVGLGLLSIVVIAIVVTLYWTTREPAASCK